MTLPNAELTAVLRDPLSAAKHSGQPIVLYVSNNVPVELIHACGCFPLQLPTAPRASYTRADHYLEPGFEPMVRSALEQLLASELECASLLILPRTIDAWQRLYYYLCELERRFGERLPEPFLYDLQQLPRASSAAYNLTSTQHLADKLEVLGGRPLEAAALRESIALYDRVRDAMGHIQALRRQQPCKLAGADALDLYRAGQRLAPECCERALRELRRRIEVSLDIAPGTRTILVGSAHDTPLLHHMIARAGGQVVADHHFHGDWWLGPSISEAGKTPMQMLSEHYHKRSLSSRSFPLPLPSLVEAATQSRAQAAVFFYFDEEEALTWDYPAQVAALQAIGLPTLLLERQSYPPAPALETQLATFFSTQRADPPLGQP